MPARSPRSKVLQALEARATGAGLEELAEQTSLHPSTIARMLRRHAPLADALKNVDLEYFKAGWRWVYSHTLEDWIKKRETGDLTSGDSKNYAVTLGIASEKYLLLCGQPTQIVGNVHEVRLDISAIAVKLRQVAERRPLQVGAPVQRVIEGTAKVLDTQAPAAPVT